MLGAQEEWEGTGTLSGCLGMGEAAGREFGWDLMGSKTGKNEMENSPTK